MAKIKNRFTRKAILTVHDNLLSDLYRLNFEHEIDCRKINGEQYLVNEASGRGYKVGLRTKIPVDLLTIDGEISSYEELSDTQQRLIFNKLKDKLCFSNIEILLTNILLDKFLNNSREFDISFEEIESYYRKKSSCKNIPINDLTYKRYINTINNLAAKDVYLKTSASFRKPKYGVNNRSFNQSFLSILNGYHYGKNNIVFSYSFEQFGKVLKLSRRYSNELPATFYRFSFNQVMKHSIAYYIGQQIFINKYENLLPFELDINDILQSVMYESRSNTNKGYSIASKLDGFKSQPNKNRTYKMVIKYIEDLIKGFKSVHHCEIKYSYDETESFCLKHEFDYDEDDNLNYEFTTDDINQDVSVSVIIHLQDEDISLFEEQFESEVQLCVKSSSD